MPRTAEHVAEGHPDKFCDQIADRILDEALRLADKDDAVRKGVRTAIECLAKDNLVVVAGEIRLPDEIRARLNAPELAREIWKNVGYGKNGQELTVIDYIGRHSPDIAMGVDGGGAGDQGIMVGYACDETPEFMPQEWVYARDICMKLAELRKSQTLPWLRSDCKSQVTMSGSGAVTNVIVAAWHTNEVSNDEIGEQTLRHVIQPVILCGAHATWRKVEENGRQFYIVRGAMGDIRVVINGAGRFVIGGPAGDAGVVGRKIVVDAYGPRIAVGGGAYSGKDPTKVDRSAAYMARYVAKTIVAEKIAGARECLVKLAYGIGQLHPEMVSAIINGTKDVSDWVSGRFPDLSPQHIIERFGLQTPTGWSYLDTAAYGHYGRSIFPWEQV